MNTGNLIHKNITHFAKYYKLVAVAVIITVAIIVGSLMVGDSVRTTLIKRVAERLGDTETIVFSRNSYMDAQFMDTPLFRDEARGILLTNGFISQGGKLIPVFVWGVNDMSVTPGSAYINNALAKELGNRGNDDAIVLRLPAAGLVPSGSLFVTENYTTSLRLSLQGIIDTSEGGNISMKNEQVIPLNIFVDRDELAAAMETEDKINLILSEKTITDKELETVWDYSISGLSASRKDGFTEIVSDRVFLQQQVVETIEQNNSRPNRLFSYLANSIMLGSESIPYSFVTAADKYKEEPLGNDEIILSDYSARRLHARQGDSIQVTFFTSEDLKTLNTDTVRLVVKQIVPLAELHQDKTLSADFPGLSDVERCTDWDSDLPINMDLITDEDERYWEQYRSTPKAIIGYDAVAAGWSNAYGNATAVRVDDLEPDLSELRPEMFGIQLIYPRETGLFAARNGVDFSSLFLALGFFIIVSAILLMLIPLSEMFYKRRGELSLMQSLGFTPRRITRILWLESAPVVLVSAVVGVVAGLLYTALIMWLLGNVWKGATHTEGFAVYPGISTILIGLVVSISLSLLLLRHTIVRQVKKNHLRVAQPTYLLQKGCPKGGVVGAKSNNSHLIYAIIATLLSLLTILINLITLRSVVLFVIIGILLIGTAALWGNYLIYRKGTSCTVGFDITKLIWSALYAGKKQAILSFFTLAMGVFIVFSVGLNRKGFADSTQIRTGTGGYSLWCESSVPVYHNLATDEGREKLSLTTLPHGTDVLQCLRYGADDASCLNLNKVSTPTVLGVDMQAMAASDFRIEQSIYPSDTEDIFERMQSRKGTVYPALIDATVLTWGLMMSLGDTLYYEGDRGQTIAIQLAGTLSNSIFQGHILVDRSLFAEMWEETAGSEIFLLKTREEEKEEVKNLLSQALNEYGVRVSTTNDRLRQFNTVTDTYLTIFLTLGGLGLLLGIMSFIIAVRKNLTMRRSEIQLYRTLGFTDSRIGQTLYCENVWVPLYAIATGVISSLVGVCTSFANAGIWVWLMAVFFTLFFIGCVMVFVRKEVQNEIQKSKVADI